MTANTEDLDYAQALSYLQHFRDKECDEDVISDTESIFTLCWFYAGLIEGATRLPRQKQSKIPPFLSVRLSDMLNGIVFLVS